VLYYILENPRENHATDMEASYMDAQKKFKFWLHNDFFDNETKAELKKIKDDLEEITDRFYKDLEFGTGGLRGIIGAGSNRMNIYTVRKASQGLANYICKNGEEAKRNGIVIAYDSRSKSPEFALEAAKVFTANGIKTYLFDELRPTPELSFAVRFLNAAAGVVITASHNPKDYNGYKVYSEDGAQLSLEHADAVLSEIKKITDITDIKLMEKDEALRKGLMEIIGKEIDDEYISRLKTLTINPELVHNKAAEIKIVYTPLHGTGNKPVRGILDEVGFKRVLVVKEQEKPDPEFSTVRNPNPEDKSALDLAIKLAEKEDADIVIGTDPDCDRVGLAVKGSAKDYIVLTGNQTGCLLMEYILSQKKAKGLIPPNGFVVKTIVTTELARSIANYYGVELIEVLTGFKFIGEKIKELDEFGNKKFIFGFEESYGYLAGTFSRDKDGVVTSMLVAEVAAYYKSRGMSLFDGLLELFEKYGFSVEDIKSYAMEGKDGLEKISHVMKELRESKLHRFNRCEAVGIRDYLKREKFDFVTGSVEQLELPRSNVLYYEMRDKSWFCIRPSGTEPKIKIYFGASDIKMDSAKRKLENLKQDVLAVVENLLFA
jgi:phosphoglucomutase